MSDAALNPPSSNGPATQLELPGVPMMELTRSVERFVEVAIALPGPCAEAQGRFADGSTPDWFCQTVTFVIRNRPAFAIPPPDPSPHRAVVVLFHAIVVLTIAFVPELKSPPPLARPPSPGVPSDCRLLWFPMPPVPPIPPIDSPA